MATKDAKKIPKLEIETWNPQNRHPISKSKPDSNMQTDWQGGKAAKRVAHPLLKLQVEPPH